MIKSNVPGTTGYTEALDKFIEATLSILENQPSILPGKELITWSRLVFQKI